MSSNQNFKEKLFDIRKILKKTLENQDFQFPENFARIVSTDFKKEFQMSAILKDSNNNNNENSNKSVSLEIHNLDLIVKFEDYIQDIYEENFSLPLILNGFLGYVYSSYTGGSYSLKRAKQDWSSFVLEIRDKNNFQKNFDLRDDKVVLLENITRKIGRKYTEKESFKALENFLDFLKEKFKSCLEKIQYDSDVDELDVKDSQDEEECEKAIEEKKKEIINLDQESNTCIHWRNIFQNFILVRVLDKEVEKKEKNEDSEEEEIQETGEEYYLIHFDLVEKFLADYWKQSDFDFSLEYEEKKNKEKKEMKRKSKQIENEEKGNENENKKERESESENEKDQKKKKF